MDLPQPEVIRGIVQRYARLRARLAAELGDRPLVLPNSHFFPDVFRPEQRGVRKLVTRMQKHAGMRDIPIRPRLIQLEGATDPCASGSCSTGSKDKREASGGGGGSCCGGSHPVVAGEDFARLIDEEETWRLQIPDVEVTNPVVLTCNVARALGHIFLFETLEEGEQVDQPQEITGELAAVALGFGVLLMEGSYIYSKSCGGPRIARVTLMGPAELGLATALFVQSGGHSARDARKVLDTTQRAAFSEAMTWCDSNQALINTLRTAPEQLSQGKFEISESKPLLTRLFGSMKKSRKSEEELIQGATSMEELESMLSTLPTTQPRKSRKADPKRDELRALVDEAMDEA